MPGVGITDARQILHLVGERAARVRLSVAAQLLSAACYAPALVGIAGLRDVGRDRAVRAGAALLLVGAMGSAADAVFHLLATEMVGPGIDRAAVTPLMERMQGPGLLFIAPLLAAFFLGSAWLSYGMARAGVVPRLQPWLFALALAVAALGGSLAAGRPAAARAVGLGVLGLVAAAQVWLGLALGRSGGSADARGAIHHVDVTARDLARSAAFYDLVLPLLGFRRGSGAPEGPTWAGDGLEVGLQAARSPGAHDRYVPGLHHLAFTAPSRAAVDDLHQRLAALGVPILDPPAEYPRYAPGYYAVFFADPDGLKLEYVFTPRWPI
jgi:catechol 2,3-dioxygenase-like lactoylglutathione lyase family enzyme